MSRFHKNFLRWTLPIAMFGVAVAGASGARELSFATGYAPGSMGAEAGNTYADALKEYSGGDLTARVYPMSLLNFLEIPNGVRDGMADSGPVLTSYFPAEYPNINVVTEISMLLELIGASKGLGGLAYAGALSEYIFQKCPDCVSEFQRQNQVFFSGGASSTYMLLCNQPVRSVAEVKGKRLRVAGGQWARWVSEVEATSVSVPQHETYEALDQGVVDCTAHSAPELTNVNLMEVVSDITTGMPGGVYAGVAHVINTETWRSLSDEQRRALLHAGSVLTAALAWGYAEEAKRNIQTARERDDIEVHEPAADLVEKTRDFIERDVNAIAALQAKYGIENVDEKLATFRPLLDKWVGLVQDVDSRKELADLYWRDVFSKVDASRYGM